MRFFLRNLLLCFVVSYSTLGGTSISRSSPWSKFFISCPTTKNCLKWQEPPRLCPGVGFTERSEPDYQRLMLKGKEHFVTMEADIEPIVLALMGEDPCDEFLTLYMAKIVAYFEPGTAQYDALNEQVRYVLDRFLEIAASGTYSIEGGVAQHFSAPQAKCLAEQIRISRGV